MSLFILIQDNVVVYSGSVDPRAPVAAPAAPVITPAYDLPSLSAADVVVDGNTVNKDGSIWAMSPSASPGPTGGASAAVQESVGYISPVKMPELWAWCKAHMTTAGFTQWDAAWQANKFGLYRVDPRPLIASGQLNIVLLAELLQPYGSFVQ